MGKVVKILIVLVILAGAVRRRLRVAAEPGRRGRRRQEGRGRHRVDHGQGGRGRARSSRALKFHVKSKISGIVKRCHAEVGDRVAAGDPLFDIVPDPTPSERVEAERQLERAQSAYDQAERDVDRANELSLSGHPLDGRSRRQACRRFDQARIALGAGQGQPRAPPEGTHPGRRRRHGIGRPRARRGNAPRAPREPRRSGRPADDLSGRNRSGARSPR